MKVALCIGHHPNARGTDMILAPYESEYEFWKRNAPKIKGYIDRNGDEAVITNRSYAGGTTPAYAAKACNATRADLAVELHFNSTVGATGTETYYWYSSTKGKLAAAIMQAGMVSVLGLRDRGIKAISHIEERGYYYYKDTVMPAILIEPCFANSSETDCRRLITCEESLCYIIAGSIIEYFDRVR